MDEEAGQLHVQLLADVFADFDQVGAALAGLRFMPVLERGNSGGKA